MGILTAISNDSDGDHYGEYNTLSGAGQGFQTGVYNIINNSGNSNHFGILNQLSGTGSGIHYGIRNEITGAGTGDQEGMSTLISNTSDSNHFGLNTRLSGTGNGTHTGALFSMSDTGSGFHIGVRTNFSEGTGILTGYWTEFGGNIGSSSQNQIAAYNSYFVGGDGILAGSYTDIRNSVNGTGSQYGSFLTNSSPGSGTHYGVRNTLAGSGTGEQYGVYNTISNTGNASHVGVRNTLSGTGSGYQTGVLSSFSAGSGNLTGYWTEFGGTLGDGNQIGAFNNYFSGGNGILAGVYTDIQNSVTGTGPHYGTFSAIHSPGGGTHFGNYNSLSGAGAGAKYGTYNTINSTAGGTHYGVYSDVQKAGGFAGYFLGDVAVDVNSLYVDATNNRLGIRTNAPASTVHIIEGTTSDDTGGLRLQHFSSGNYWTLFTAGSNNFWFAYNGALASWIQPNGTYTISDKRLKNNIHSLDRVLERVMKLNPVTYQYISDEKNNQTIGFLAQEVKTLFPEAVALEEGYGYYG
ncbi:MAG TPA: tail fiber domain-containing protein, partial [Aequorivita sp.]|nr:tail fiber domain-containing protein [Aequorivita sp.]